MLASLGGYQQFTFNQNGLAVVFFEMNDAVETLLKGVVVADDDQLVKAAHAPYLLGQITSPLAVHVLGRLVEERDVESAQMA